jgi:uncharacterized protein (DUF433 family)
MAGVLSWARGPMSNNGSAHEFYGQGIYTVGDAARLTMIPRASIRRWLWGSPLWTPRQGVDDDLLSLGFFDLMEIRFVHAFRQHGVSLQHIRQALTKARELFDLEYPLSTLRFKTDGRKIFADILPDGDQAQRWLIEMPSGQHSFDFILRHLYEGLAWDESGHVQSWRPRSNRVILDPKRSFGEPIVDDEGVPTETLARAYLAEQSVDAVAQWYEVDPASVEDAVEFELSLAA